MAMFNLKMFTAPAAAARDALVDVLSSKSPELEQLVPLPRDPNDGMPEVSNRVDQIRYELMLERELDRQLLSEVEREDSDALDRVRAALYQSA